MIEVTINKPVAVDDGKTKNIPVKIALNVDHIRMIQPRLEGGSIITFADGAGLIVAESKTDVLTQTRSKTNGEPLQDCPESIERDRPENSEGCPESSKH